MATSRKRRLTVDPDGDYLKESRKLTDYLFNDCPGNVADEVVIGYLKAIRAAAGKHPGTGADMKNQSPQMRALVAALME